MEGWLQVPPSERNLIGRAAWKPRYIRLTNSPVVVRAPISAATTPARPITSAGINPSNSPPPAQPAAAARGVLDRCHSIHQVSMLASTAAVHAPDQWNLAIYKHKTDSEPVIRYPIQNISSCYIREMPGIKKKSIVQPTLVVTLRSCEVSLNHSSSSSSSSRTSRRRSHHDGPSRDGLKKENTASTALMFRANPDEYHCLERWIKEIQSRILSAPRNTVDTSFREGFAEGEYDDTPTSSPSSLFLINGEPNTALLSPSIRSRNSNLSSIDSDDRSSFMSSTASEIIGPPRTNFEERRPQSAVSEHSRTPYSSTTAARKVPEAVYPNASSSGIFHITPGRRETILDRFFSSTAPSSPAVQQGTKPMSSMARFEALMDELEAPREGNSASIELPPLLHHPIPPVYSDIRPRRIPSPTQRALEFVSTGNRMCSPKPKHRQRERRDTVSPKYTTSSDSKNPVPPFPARSDSDNTSLDTLRTASTSSINVTVNTTTEVTPLSILPTSHGQGKRHSLADFSLRLATPQMFGRGGPRRGSHGDLTKLPESGDESSEGFSVSPVALVMEPVVEYGETVGGRSHHLRAGRPLFREFSF